MQFRRLVPVAISVIFSLVLPTKASPMNEPGERSASRPGAQPHAAPQAQQTSAGRESADSGELCNAIAAAAAENAIPIPFFTRLIWQESRFKTYAVSRAGAQGIAQFMPRTAAWRGLDDPFDPMAALPESAEFLRELRRQLGNLGLAAAAYNAGPGRVREWLSGRASLPRETRAYVRIVTGRTVDEWAKSDADSVEPGEVKDIPCSDMAKLVIAAYPRPKPDGAKRAPWGLQLVGHWSETFAIASFARLQKKFAPILADHEPMVIKARMGGYTAAWTQVRVGADTRQDADSLCSRLRAAGGACVVMRN
jgi:hypothetical protein